MGAMLRPLIENMERSFVPLGIPSSTPQFNVPVTESTSFTNPFTLNSQIPVSTPGPIAKTVQQQKTILKWINLKSDKPLTSTALSPAIVTKVQQNINELSKDKELDNRALDHLSIYLNTTENDLFGDKEPSEDVYKLFGN